MQYEGLKSFNLRMRDDQHETLRGMEYRREIKTITGFIIAAIDEKLARLKPKAKKK